MSVKQHLFWRSVSLFGVFVAGWCLMWFASEFVTYHKGFFEALISSWWNFVGFCLLVPVVAFASFIDDLLGFEENKQENE